MIPEDRRYTETHVWVRNRGRMATVGITDHAQKELGAIAAAELPTVGMRVEKGQQCAVLESVKAAVEIYAPIAGVIAEVNLGLNDRPDRINQDPYGEGWILKLAVFDRSGFNTLMDARAYERLLASG